MQVTIKEIAKEAEVSTATVSMILNNKDKNISEATRNRVLEIAKKRNYIPNTMARSLVTRHTRTIGLIMPDIVNPFFPEIARGAEDRASKSRYSIIYCNTDDNLIREDSYVDILTEKMVDGIIFTHSADRKGSTERLKRCQVPIILIDRDYDLPNVIGKVLVDNTKASQMAVNYLLSKGYRKIAYIAGSMNTQTAQDRLEGYKKALEESNLECSQRYIKIGEYKSQWGSDATKEFLREGIPFDAIFGGNDLIAIGAMKALKEAGLKVPDDIGVMGFDDIYMSSIVEPSLTTIKQPNYEMGYKAAELLINSIEGHGEQREAHDAEKAILGTELTIRESTR
ncbi:LacI family transcriptional regulator [Anoxybacterium hadale]|uniref:LacI family transcriptional regulator n=2 Tax=Anoxybacterium hadale TaxID=3408580 RepID=A0ACD1AH39_9FIRM|nr:LacI family transcriptional regulator [Clostridiales bacterium]